MNLQQRAAKLRADIATQRRWINEHGGNLAGYVLRYGSADDVEHYGDGGEAIYTADSNQLSQLESELAIIEGAS